MRHLTVTVALVLMLGCSAQPTETQGDGGPDGTDLVGTSDAFDGGAIGTVDGRDAGPAASTPVCRGSVARIEAARIHVTRSTNSPEITVVVYCDGSAERTLGQPGSTNVLDTLPEVYASGSPAVLRFLRNLDAVGDVSAIPASHAPAHLPDACAKSASFGTVTTVTADGKTSGDLQCLLSPTAEQMALAGDCRVLAPWP